MKNVKKMVSFLLAMVMACSMTFTTAFAVDENDSESTPTRHTIEITIPPQSEDDGIMPCIWYDLGNQSVHSDPYRTKDIDIPDRYCAFEASASDENGNAVNGSYTVALMKNGGLVCSDNHPVDTQTYKTDWITVSPGTHYFIISNYADCNLKVTIKYYSWK